MQYFVRSNLVQKLNRRSINVCRLLSSSHKTNNEYKNSIYTTCTITSGFIGFGSSYFILRNDNQIGLNAAFEITGTSFWIGSAGSILSNSVTLFRAVRERLTNTKAIRKIVTKSVRIGVLSGITAVMFTGWMWVLPALLPFQDNKEVLTKEIIAGAISGATMYSPFGIKTQMWGGLFGGVLLASINEIQFVWQCYIYPYFFPPSDTLEPPSVPQTDRKFSSISIPKEE